MATYTSTNKDVTIYNKQTEPQMKGPQDSSTGLWTIDIRKESPVIWNNIKQHKYSRAPSIKPVPTFKHIVSVGIAYNTKFKLAKIYQKYEFSTYTSIFVKLINAGHLSTWPNIILNIIQKRIPQTTATRKFYLDQALRNI